MQQSQPELPEGVPAMGHDESVWKCVSSVYDKPNPGKADILRIATLLPCSC